MEFLKALFDIDELTKENKESPYEYKYRYRQFIRLQKDDVVLSIQASYGHYCTPRLTLKNLEEYRTMEFALLIDDQFVRVREILPNCPRLEEIENYFDTVYPFVPVELIEIIFRELFFPPIIH